MSLWRIAVGGLRRALIGIAALVCCVMALSDNRADEVDSGWAVGSPTVESAAPSDPKQQVIFRNVQGPVLTIRSPHDGDVPPRAGDGSSQVAARPDGIDGWRSAGSEQGPLTESWREVIGAPKNDQPANPLTAENSASNAPAKTDTAQPPPEGRVVVEQPAAPLTPDTRHPTPSPPPTPDTGHRPQGGHLTPAPPPPLPPQLIALRSRVRNVLTAYYRRPLNSQEHDPWEVMHGMLAYGVYSRVRAGSPRGEPVTAVGWLCYNKPCKGMTMLHVTPKGELRARYGVGLQGHLGQFLALLAQCRVSPEYPIRVAGHEFTIHDLIEAEKKTCYPGSELTFKLIALQYYLDLNETWVNDQGVEWDIPRLVREELAQPIRGAACGGTHRLSGLSLTVKNRLRRGEPLDGEYARAAEFVQDYHQYAFRLQNPDGSLSTAWFQGRGDNPDIDRRIKTTGHILEWLCYSLSDEELRDPRTVRAVTYLANLMYANYDRDWEVGPMCHAIHALVLYDERVFQPFDSEAFNVAQAAQSVGPRRMQPAMRRR